MSALNGTQYKTKKRNQSNIWSSSPVQRGSLLTAIATFPAAKCVPHMPRLQLMFQKLPPVWSGPDRWAVLWAYRSLGQTTRPSSRADVCEAQSSRIDTNTHVGKQLYGCMGSYPDPSTLHDSNTRVAEGQMLADPARSGSVTYSNHLEWMHDVKRETRRPFSFYLSQMLAAGLFSLQTSAKGRFHYDCELSRRRGMCDTY